MIRLIVTVLIATLALTACGERQDPKAAEKAKWEKVIADAKAEAEEKKKRMVRQIDCADAPAEAVVELDDNLQGVARVLCYNYGHVLTSPERKIWAREWVNLGNERSAPVTVLVEAQARPGEELTADTRQMLGHDAHFTAVELRDVETERLAGIFEQFRVAVPNIVIEEGSTAVEIIATSNTGVEQRIVMSKINNIETVGYVCTPECKPEHLLSVISTP